MFQLNKNTTKISVSLIVKNNEKWLNYIFNKFKNFEVIYHDTIEFEYFIYENNSTDNTKTLIKNFMENRKGKYLLEDLENNCTLIGISVQRGLWMNFIRRKNKENHGKLNSDYVLLIDSEVHFQDDIIDELLNTFKKHKNIASLSCYCISEKTIPHKNSRHYYDSFAMVTMDNIDYKINNNTCMFNHCGVCIRLRYKSNLNKHLINKSGIIEVKSAFGCMCIIPTIYYNECNYDDNEFKKYNNNCEHYHFNQQLRKFGKICINADINIYIR
jgi:hypothetical protein